MGLRRSLAEFFHSFLLEKEKERQSGKPMQGLLRREADHRDYLAVESEKKLYPDAYELPITVAIEQQGRYNSCVAHAQTTAIEMLGVREGWPSDYQLSRMDAYNEGRKVSGTYPHNQGVYILNSWKVLQKKGVTIEKIFPYNEKNYNKSITPVNAPFAWSFRGWHIKFRYYWIREKSNEGIDLLIKDALFNRKVPVVFGIKVGKEFSRTKENPYDGIKKPRSYAHCMLITGWDDHNSTYKILNSWGIEWGWDGTLDVKKSWVFSEAFDMSYPDTK